MIERFSSALNVLRAGCQRMRQDPVAVHGVPLPAPSGNGHDSSNAAGHSRGHMNQDNDLVIQFRMGGPEGLCYSCGCGKKILVGFEKAAGWKRCTTGGAIVWGCPACVKADPALKPLTPAGQ